MNCPTCKDTGHVTGHWMPEVCPDCNGWEPEPAQRGPDMSIPWGLIVGIAVPVVFVAIVQWALWSFLLGVFA